MKTFLQSLLVVLCLASAFLCYRMFVQVRADEQQRLSDLRQVKVEIEQLKRRMQALSSRTAPAPPLSIAAADMPEDIDARVMQALREELAQRTALEAYRDRLQARNREMREADEQRYGEELFSLYDIAVGQKEGDLDRDEAFQEMLDAYPDANLTAMAIAERALASAFEGSIGEVEYYYELLQGKEAFHVVVTDAGVEAVPVLQGYLAHQYTRQNRREDALAMIERIGASDAAFFTVRGETGPKWVSKAQLIEAIERMGRIPDRNQPGRPGPRGENQ